MAVRFQEVVKANLVLVGFHLLSSQQAVESFKSQAGTEVVSAGIGFVADMNSGLTAPGQSLVLNRDRITLETSSSRSAVIRDYPERENLSRFAEIAGLAISNSTDSSDVAPSAFGYNVEMVYDQDSGAPAFYYLASRLFKHSLPGVGGGLLVGGTGQLIFDENGRRWQVNVEPRFKDGATSRLFLSLNMHRNEQRLPEEDEIEASLDETWNKAWEFATRLDGCL